MYSYVRTALKTSLDLAGIEITRKKSPEAEMPPLFEAPLEALRYEQGGKRAAFKCRLDLTVNQNGLSYSPNRYHPYVSALREYEIGGSTSYMESTLRTYYERHQPSHAGEAFVGFERWPVEYKNLPPHLYRLAPWHSLTADEVDQQVRYWSRENAKGVANLDQGWSLETDGFQYHGPVSERRGELEYQRLIKVYESLKADGYDRSQGHVELLILRRGQEIRLLNYGEGNHRAAAMAALGYETVPATFYHPYSIDFEDIEYWPQVRQGLWSSQQAENYIDHLFRFDSRRWARENGLLAVQNPLHG